MGKAYSKQPSELVILRHAQPLDRLRFDMAVMLWATTEEALANWQQRQQK